MSSMGEYEEAWGILDDNDEETMNNSQRKFLDDKIVMAKMLLNEVIDNCRSEIPLDLLDEIENFIANKTPSVLSVQGEDGKFTTVALILKLKY